MGQDESEILQVSSKYPGMFENNKELWAVPAASVPEYCGLAAPADTCRIVFSSGPEDCVTLDLKTGQVLLSEGMTADQGAQVFWEAVRKIIPDWMLCSCQGGYHGNQEV